jgi:DsbC/DsbD-like thiol-disulfide interchange protein/cytochrome c biogenesis protein CcdA
MLLWACLFPLCAPAAQATSPPTEVAPAIDAAQFDAPSSSETVYTDNVRARLLAERTAVSPGQSLDVALVLDIRPNWHTYWRNPGDSGEAPRIDWQIPEGVSVGEIRWPLPERIPVGPLVNYGYSDRAVHLSQLRVPPDWPAGAPVRVTAEATWLVCEEECIPEQGRFALSIATSSPGQIPTQQDVDPEVRSLFDGARANLPTATVVAAVLEPTDDELLLRVPSAAIPEEAIDVHFFPDQWGLIDHAAPQPWSVEGADLVLKLQPGDAAASTDRVGLLRVATAVGSVGLRLDATGSAGLIPGESADSEAPASDLGLPLALLFALLGGLILNLMPCVFPVLAIKALGLAGQAGAGFRHRLAHGLAYTAGVLAFFLALGALLLGLRAAGAAVGWGFQLQSPLFVVLMAYLFVVLGLSLTGAVTLGAGLMGVGQGWGPDAGAPMGGDKVDGGAGAHVGAFITGGLAALVAAPCTAPFMGAALGYAMTISWPSALAVMAALGFGMALPLLLLSLSPRLARAMPRPGAWMETLKQGLAFPMFATAAWLFWVLTVQTGPTGLAAGFAGALLLAFGLWLHERGRMARAPWPRAGSGGRAGVFGGGALARRRDAAERRRRRGYGGHGARGAGATARRIRASARRLTAPRRYPPPWPTADPSSST